MNSSVFNDFLNSARDVEEWTASGKLFQTEVAAAEKHLLPTCATKVNNPQAVEAKAEGAAAEQRFLVANKISC